MEKRKILRKPIMVFGSREDINFSTIKILLKSVFVLSTFLVGNFCWAATSQYSINLDKKTIIKGYTVSAFDDVLKLSLVPEVLDEPTGVLIQEIVDDIPSPWNKDRISKIYQFEFLNKKAYDNHKPFYIQFSYLEESDKYKQVFFYDKNFNSWRPLPTRDFPNEKFVRSLIHLPFARIAVFEDPEVMTVGKASWYGYKGGNFAASPDFSKGSILRVYNIENNKFVDIEVNDYGPDRKLHPDRAIDLDKVAFSHIASLGEGTIDVNIEPISIKAEKGKVLGISEKGSASAPVISAKSAIIVDASTGEILYNKNAKEIVPLASLTKLVAVKVFLDIENNLEREVIYLEQDEKYNYEYCTIWESARLRLKEGDIVTVKDLLYSSLVGSANNSIETLARATGVDRDEFIKKMNEYVKNLGLKNTRFVEPTGLSVDNVSSAHDYAIILRDITKNWLIGEITRTYKYEFETKNTKIPHRIINTDKLVRYNDRIITSKTGYLNEAGYCLSTEYQTPNGKIITVLLGADTRDNSFSETEDLFLYGERLLQTK